MTKDDEIFQHVKHEPALKIPLILKILEIPDILKTPIISMVQKGHGDFKVYVAKTRVSHFFQYIRYAQKWVLAIFLGAEFTPGVEFGVRGLPGSKKCNFHVFLPFSVRCMTGSPA